MKHIIKNKTLIIIIVLPLLVVSLWGIWYVGYSRYVKYIGIDIRPSRDYPPTEVNYYLQHDPAWSSDKLGNSNYSLGQAGCLIASIASAISDLGVEVDPQQLNTELTAVDAYTADGDLIWYKIKEAFPTVDYHYTRVPTSVTIEQDLKAGRLPVVNVHYYQSGATHWVLIVGAADGDFLIFDPLNSKLDCMPLSIHGKIYAYRVIIKKQ